MFRGPPLFILAIIVLALALASCVSASAAEPAPAREGARPIVFHPTTFICDPPAWPGAQPRPIPPGKQLKDLCPPGAHTYLPGPSVPHRSHAPPPDVMIDWTDTGYTLHSTQKPQPDTNKKTP